MCDNNNSFSAKVYRSRIEYEDGVLNARTNIFLVVNGLGAVAVGLENATDQTKFIMTIVIMLINLLWIICAFESFRFIKALTLQHQKLIPDDPIETLRNKTLGSWYWIRPTNIMSLYVPWLVLLGWIAGVCHFLL